VQHGCTDIGIGVGVGAGAGVGAKSGVLIFLIVVQCISLRLINVRC